ncbi:Hypothetical protein PHPALM_8716 [Phytophthora palmivora]|uniref:Uncharacterized protein n=1 Tax=Phytophthora palmivora TaxID=4796 RepID=A0A2P4Y946_9STRA|nr:Hypothetical protein PHPALM_8716 [Phytophthora palmivora]
MSPTQASPVNFPRLNGRNFIICVTAALDGKNLLGFVTQADYAGDSDVDLDPDEELNPAYSHQLDASLTRLGVPKPDSKEDSSTSESSDRSSDGSAGDDGDVDMGQENPPMIQSFTAQKQQELDRAEKLKAKSQQLSSKKLRLMEAKAKAFLIKTIDDQHVLMVKEKTTAYEIYQTLCNKYEGAAVHSDPYYIQSYLMALKYEEGSDLATFIYDLESAMTAAADSTNSVLSDEQKSLYLYHSLPTDWKSELAVWKGSRKYTPYEDLKRNIETKTRAETAMQASAPEQVLVAAPSNTDTVPVSSRKCNYCQRDKHDTADCYILQRHLYNGQIKAGTVLPANFKLQGNDYKINFPNAKKCVLFFAHCAKFEAKTGGGKSLYQFQAKSTDSDQEAHMATSGAG